MRFSVVSQLLWGLILVNLIVVCIGQDYTLVVEDASHTTLCAPVSVMRVNESIPGPTLNLTYGETVTVNVINNSTHGLTIHWHGVKQPRNPWSDGPEFVTQCLIESNSNFTYEVILSDEEGTLWWHAHSEWTRATVYGALVIRPGEDRDYPFSTPDGEEVIILGTWFEEDVMNYVNRYLRNGTNLPFGYDALTINGLPGDIYDNEFCYKEMTEMEVESGKTYLLRIINAAMNEDLIFGVAEHNLTVVGTDAAYIEPVTTDFIMITSGQTMDVILVADKLEGYYYMEAQNIGDGQNTFTTGLVKYNPTNMNYRVHPMFPESMSVANFTNRFVALNNSNYTYDVPQTVDTQIFMTVALNTEACEESQNCNNGVKSTSSFSNVTFMIPEVDVLQAYYLNMTDEYATDFPETSPVFNYTNAFGVVGDYAEVNGTRVFVVEYNTTIEMVFQGTNIRVEQGVAHPIHVHGYSFYNVAWGYGNYDNTTAEYNLVDPPLVNTVALPANGWVAIRFRADNPGVWFMHCHLERHSFTGMDAIMIVKNGNTTDTSILDPPYNLTGTCGDHLNQRIRRKSFLLD